MDKVLLYFALKYKGQWTKIYEALDKKERISQEELEHVEDNLNCNYMTVLNPLYPDTLKNCHKPPFVIFYKGDISLLTSYRKIVNFVVEDWNDKYSVEQYSKIVKAFKQENKTYIVNKINGASNELEMNGNKTIAVVNGIKDLNDYGLVISETVEENKEQDNFYTRVCYNLAKALVVFNVDRNSSTMNFINSAVNDNKDLFVIPQCTNAYRFANNYLIKQGAKLVEYPSDILNEI